MDFISNKIVQALYDNNIIDKNKLIVYQYEINKIMSNLAVIVSIILIGLSFEDLSLEEMQMEQGGNIETRTSPLCAAAISAGATFVASIIFC